MVPHGAQLERLHGGGSAAERGCFAHGRTPCTEPSRVRVSRRARHPPVCHPQSQCITRTTRVCACVCLPREVAKALCLAPCANTPPILTRAAAVDDRHGGPHAGRRTRCVRRRGCVSLERGGAPSGPVERWVCAREKKNARHSSYRFSRHSATLGSLGRARGTISPPRPARASASVRTPALRIPCRTGWLKQTRTRAPAQKPPPVGGPSALSRLCVSLASSDTHTQHSMQDDASLTPVLAGVGAYLLTACTRCVSWRGVGVLWWRRPLPEPTRRPAPLSTRW